MTKDNIAKYMRELKGRMDVPQELLEDIGACETKGEAKRIVKAYRQKQDAPLVEEEITIKKVKAVGKAKKR